VESTRWEKIQACFHNALALPDSERWLYVERECEDGKESALEVRGMLEEQQRGSSMLDRDPREVARHVAGSTLERHSPNDFYPHRNLIELGHGGMGTVFRAEREDGNAVAIKVLRDWWVSTDRRRRFATEQKALGKLEHPSIARLYHAGMLAGGTPWFAMEYVEGQHLDAYCRLHGCPIAERLRLFRLVCEAVQYAHRLGIIHRDLKPSNILVKEDATVRLLDFGIAKQLDDSEETVTRTGMRFMTLPYAAPEQVLGEPVGTYTDIYSLGIILYEVLTGRLPFNASDVAERQAERIIVEQEPEKPSTAARRDGRFQDAGKTAWNDLDVLCLKAMQKDAHERYESAAALMRDVDHFLRGEPLEARPVSLRYRAGKFVRRNRRGVLLAALAFLAMGTLVVYFTGRLATARSTTLIEAARTQRIERFMENLFDAGDKDAGPAEDLRVVTLLDRGVQEAQGLNGDPALQTELYQTLGGIYERLGKFDRADSLLRASLQKRRVIFGEDGPEVAASLVGLGLLQLDQARLPDAERLIREAMAIERRHISAGDSGQVRATAALGRVLKERGQYEKAIEVLKTAMRIQQAGGSDDADRAATLIDLADSEFYLGRYAISDSLNRQALAIHRQIHGDKHPIVGEDLINLGHIQVNIGNYGEAERDYRRAFEILRQWYGDDHPATARAATYLAQALSRQSRYPEAQALLAHALDALERTRGPTHPQMALVLGQAGYMAIEHNNVREAEADYARMVEIYRHIYGEHHQMTALALGNLASVYMRTKDYARAEPLFRKVIQAYTETLPPDHLNLGIARIRLGRTLARQKRYREAESESLAGYEIVAKQASPSIDWLQGARQDLAAIYEALHQPEKAARFRAEAAANEPGKKSAPVGNGVR
jgi:serine/threonine-protein kinase